MPRAHAQLQALLEKEREALLSGELSRIGALTEEKERLLRLLPSSGASAAALSDLSGQIARNQALLMSAQKGVAAAEDAMKRLEKATQESAVYDRSGTVSHMRSASPGMSQKL